jgi:hypothetical protein
VRAGKFKQLLSLTVESRGKFLSRGRQVLHSIAGSCERLHKVNVLPKPEL